MDWFGLVSLPKQSARSCEFRRVAHLTISNTHAFLVPGSRWLMNNAGVRTVWLLRLLGPCSTRRMRRSGLAVARRPAVTQAKTNL